MGPGTTRLSQSMRPLPGDSSTWRRGICEADRSGGSETSSDRSRWQSAAFRLLESTLARVTAAYLVVGTDLARRYEAVGVPREKLHVVRSGVPLPMTDGRSSERKKVCQAFDLPADRPLVLCLGSLEPRKNVLELPRLLRHLMAPGASSTTSPRPFLVVAGDGPLGGRLRRARRAAGVADDARPVG